MGTKQEPGKFDCYAGLEDDEPFFVLRGRDPQAPSAIETWCSLRRTAIRLGSKPSADLEKVDEAKNIAEEMRRWRSDRGLP